MVPTAPNGCMTLIGRTFSREDGAELVLTNLPQRDASGKRTVGGHAWIDRFMVTRLQYAMFCVQRGKEFAHELKPVVDEKGGWDEIPVTGVSLAEAEEYCKWARRRLPSREEWWEAAEVTDGAIPDRVSKAWRESKDTTWFDPSDWGIRVRLATVGASPWDWTRSGCAGMYGGPLEFCAS